MQISPNFIARDGVVLGMLCVLTRLSNDLMIVGAETAAYSNKGYPVDCAEIEKIAPVYAAI